MIKLLNNSGYVWHRKENVYFKGYFQYSDSMAVFQSDNALNEIIDIQDVQTLKKFLQKIDGCFAIVIDKSYSVLAAVDRARSMPLFFSTVNGMVSDSADAIREELKIPKEAVDKDNLLELASNYYLFGHETIYKQIKQLDLGEIIEINGNVVLNEPYYFHYGKVKEREPVAIKKELTEVSYRVFERLKAVINGRPVVLSMSGGYDSRFIGCMLKNVGIENVSCYTYGKANSFEVVQSKKNAEALGFRWTCVEMKDELLSKQLDDVGLEYLDSYTGHDFTAYMQNFPAVRKLHEEGWFKPNSVFITGLCGDMPTGEYVKAEDKLQKYDIFQVANQLYDMVFTRFDVDDSHQKRWKNRIINKLKFLPIEIDSYDNCQKAIDYIYTGTCHPHWYMHMNSVHSFFGYEWLIPYWDSELLNLWYTVPTKFRINQSLYEDWLLNEICAPYGIGQKKTIGGYPKKGIKRHAQYAIGGVINYLFLHLHIPFKRKGDFNNFAPLELELFKKIKGKELICYKRSGMMQLLCQYLIEKRYGIDNYRFFINNVTFKA